MTDDKIHVMNAMIVMNDDLTVSHHFSSFLCEITLSNKRPEDNNF